MSVLINADTSDGLKFTSDTSGEIKLQSAGTDIATVNSSGLAVTGTSTANSFIPTSSTAPTNGVYLPTTNTVGLATNSTERMRIDANGNVLVNTTSAAGSGKFVAANNSNFCATMNSIGNAADYIQFWNGSQVGSITRSGGTNVAYNTSSDYRLKENVAPMSNSIDRLKQLKPSTWSWKLDGSHGEGFIAHEAQTVVPESVHGIKDAIDDEGNPVYQGIDQSKLVPLLTAALQEAITKIEDLETRIQALENA